MFSSHNKQVMDVDTFLPAASAAAGLYLNFKVADPYKRGLMLQKRPYDSRLSFRDIIK